MTKPAAKTAKCEWNNLFNEDENIKCGTTYLCWLMAHFAGNDLKSALQMYNQGPGGDLTKAQKYADSILKCASCLDAGGSCDNCDPTKKPTKKKKKK